MTRLSAMLVIAGLISCMEMGFTETQCRFLESGRHLEPNTNPHQAVVLGGGADLVCEDDTHCRLVGTGGGL